MSSRFPPPNSGDPRYASRDRSPPRYSDRRSSTQYGASLASRITDPGSRNPDDNGPSNSTRDLPREPPRGPRCFTDGPRGSGFVGGGPRGRGFAARGDFRDRGRERERERDFRDAKDLRDDSPFKRENDRDWPRRDRDFDTREPHPSPPARTRSRSPPLRGFRDSRDLQPRDLDLGRVRRDSKDAPLSATSTASDPATSTSGGFPRGGFRGRGRGDWDFRGRGRGPFLDDRDGFRARSRSQDRRWEEDPRDDRDRERGADRRDDRRVDPRDEDRKSGRVDRERDVERWKRDQAPSRVESRNPSGSLTTESIPLAPSAGNSHPASADRPALKETLPGFVPDRRASSTVLSSGNREVRRDGDKSDYFSSRAEASRERYGPRASSPPPQAPQVPAFGSLTYRSTPGAGFGTNVWRATKEDRPPQAPAAPKAAPTGPKAQVSIQAPTGPRAEQATERRPIAESREQVFRGTKDTRSTESQPQIRQEPTLAMPSAAKQSGEANSNTYIGSRRLDNHAPSSARLNAAPAPPQTVSRPISSSSSQPSGRSTNTDSGRTASPGGPPVSAATTRSTGLKTSPRQLITNIPTGPRAGRAAPPLRAQAQNRLVAPPGPLSQGPPSSLQWLRSVPPKYPKVPSIMNTVPAKRNWAGDEKDRLCSAGRNVSVVESASWGGVSATEVPRPQAASQRPSDERSQEQKAAAKKEDSSEDIEDSHVAEFSSRFKPSMFSPKPIGFGFNSDGSSDEADDDDDMDLDEEDFADSESRLSREMARLEAKKPGAPRRINCTVMENIKIAYLCERQFTEIRAKGVNDTERRTRGLDDATGQYPLGLPSPKADETGDVKLEDASSALREVPVNRVPTPTIESLPFLNSGPPTPFSELEVVQENVNNHEKVKRAIRSEILKQRDYVSKKHEQLREAYAILYKPWRIMVQEMDKKKKEEKTATPAPTSPAPAMSPAITPAPLIEGRRAGKFSSELEFERILRESEMAAREDQERRDREAKAKTDTEKEAMIPDMLDEFESEARVFKDTNQFVDARLALGIFAFVPSVDDFTPEEQKTFTDNFLAYPKKWGKIAEALPGRDYKQCIEHYYLTKEEAKYKVKLNRRWSKKGRKAGRGPQTRPKSNALMSDLGVHPELYEGDEFEAPAVAVTDTGRPKRAAAPTFGDNATEAEPATPLLTPGRKSVASKGDMNVESSIERPAAKRAKTTQPREKGQRRGKAPLLAAAPGPSPQKSERESSRGKSREPKLEDEQKAKDMEVANSLASLQAGQMTGSVSGQAAYNENWFGQAPAPVGQNEVTRQQQQQKAASQTSSYWSVPEQQDFAKLVAHFGTDWPAIANWMKSKTHIMVTTFSCATNPCRSRDAYSSKQVKNYYFRVVEQGRTDLEDMAREADEKKRRGEPLGPPPPPTVVQKRRYEMTPQSTQHRPLAPSLDVMETEDRSPEVAHAVLTQVSPQQYNQAPPRFPALAQAAPTPASASSQPPFQNAVQATIQPQMQTQQKVPQGPRIGFFTDDRKDNRSSVQPTPQQQHQQQQQQQQQQPQPQQQQQQQQQQRQLLEQQQRQPQLEQQMQQQVQQLQHVQYQERAAREQQRAQEIQLRYQQPLQTQQQLPSQQNYPGSQSSKVNAVSQPIPGPPETIQTEASPRSTQQQHHSGPPVSIRCLDSFEQQNPYGPSPVQSPAITGPLLATLSARDEPRPSSMPARLPQPEPPRPPPVAVKRSTIMSILNDEPNEPPPRKRFSDHKAPMPTPPSRSPAPQTQVYQPPHTQQAQHAIRREPPLEQSVLQPHQRAPYGISVQKQSQQAPVRPFPELATGWPAIAQVNRTYYDPRPTYQSQRAPSPQLQPTYTQPSRSAYQHAHAPSPPPPHFTGHSRTSSYSQPPQQHPAPSQALQQPSYAAGPQHQHLHRHQTTQHHPSLQAQQQQQQQQQQPQSLRQGMAYSQQLQQERMQHDPFRQQQHQQQQQHEQTRQEQMRREQQAQAAGRTFTPPGGVGYGQGPYSVAAPRGYEERR